MSSTHNPLHLGKILRADVWLAEQASYDLWQARKSFKPKVQRAPAMTA